MIYFAHLTNLTKSLETRHRVDLNRELIQIHNNLLHHKL
jgi:hypothetical protein